MLAILTPDIAIDVDAIRKIVSDGPTRCVLTVYLSENSVVAQMVPRPFMEVTKLVNSLLASNPSS